MAKDDSVDVTVVRVYVTESRARLQRLLELLRASGELRGLTVFRGIAGFGTTTHLPTDDPLGGDEVGAPDLPVVLEFFEHPDQVEKIIQRIRALIAPHHVVTFPATSLLPRLPPH